MAESPNLGELLLGMTGEVVGPVPGETPNGPGEVAPRAQLPGETPNGPGGVPGPFVMP